MSVHDIDLSGVQAASVMRAAITSALAAGHRRIGIGRLGPLQIRPGDTTWAEAIKIFEPGVALHFGRVVDGSFELRAAGIEVLGGELIRQDPGAEPAHIIRVGEVDQPADHWRITGVRTRIKDGGRKSNIAAVVRNGSHGRILACEHVSEVARLVFDSTARTFASGQAFFGVDGGTDVVVEDNRSEVLLAGQVKHLLDDAVNFTGLTGPLPDRCVVRRNQFNGHYAILSVSHGRNITAVGNLGVNVEMAAWIKAGWLSGTADVIENVRLLNNRVVDPEGRNWQAICHVFATNGGRIRNLTIDGLEVAASPRTAAPIDAVNMVVLIADGGGAIDGVDVHNVDLRLGSDIGRIVTTRGSDTDPIDGVQLRNWSVRGGRAIGFEAPYSLRAGVVPGGLRVENMDLNQVP